MNCGAEGKANERIQFTRHSYSHKPRHYDSPFAIIRCDGARGTCTGSRTLRLYDERTCSITDKRSRYFSCYYHPRNIRELVIAGSYVYLHVPETKSKPRSTTTWRRTEGAGHLDLRDITARAGVDIAKDRDGVFAEREAWFTGEERYITKRFATIKLMLCTKKGSSRRPSKL